MSKLPFRLQKIAELVTGKRVCDVGCDHGKLADYLLSSSKVENVYFGYTSNLNILSNRMFMGTAVAKIVIPRSVVRIGYQCFYQWHRGKDLHFGVYEAKLPRQAF